MSTLAPLYALRASQVLDPLQNNTVNVEKYACCLLDRVKERDGVVKAWAYLSKSVPGF
jgi:hypothetical protein